MQSRLSKQRCKNGIEADVGKVDLLMSSVVELTD